MIKSWMFIPQLAAGPQFLAGWSYRKAVTLSRASGAIVNYQRELLLGESSGATGEDVDCGGLCQTDFDDIRFTTSDGVTLLDYWIESITGATPNQLATIWIEFDNIGTDATTFYMYYGNVAAPAVSNGANTFIKFDDFERGNDGDTIGGAWTEIDAHVHISTEQDRGDTPGYFGTRGAKFVGQTGGNRPAASIPMTAASQEYSIRLHYYRENATAYFAPIQHGNGTKRLMVGIDAAGNIVYYSGGWVGTGASDTADTWGIFEVNNLVFAAGTFDIWRNDVLIKQNAAMDTSVALQDIIKAYGDNAAAGRDAWIDLFIVRNWRPTGPVWGAWGAQETP